MKRKESRTTKGINGGTPYLVVHVPHASVKMPEKWRDKILLDEELLRREVICMTDWYTDDLFGMELAQGPAVTGEAAKPRYVRAPYSRLVCDMERFRDPAQEGMTAKGMWICYEKTADGLPLKEADAAHIDEVLAVYDRHHAVLTK
ncbi:MAG: N-formylglutamate amidohydrolase, partial [Clostridiales bacterium]|nr:N-formylglutamate amidohydrolase [Clostridiales bacterium]